MGTSVAKELPNDSPELMRTRCCDGLQPAEANAWNELRLKLKTLQLKHSELQYDKNDQDNHRIQVIQRLQYQLTSCEKQRRGLLVMLNRLRNTLVNEVLNHEITRSQLTLTEQQEEATEERVAEMEKDLELRMAFLEKVNVRRQREHAAIVIQKQYRRHHQKIEHKKEVQREYNLARRLSKTEHTMAAKESELQQQERLCQELLESNRAMMDELNQTKTELQNMIQREQAAMQKVNAKSKKLKQVQSQLKEAQEALVAEQAISAKALADLQTKESQPSSEET